MRGCGAELFTQPLIATTKGATGGEIEEIEVMVRTAGGAVFIYHGVTRHVAPGTKPGWVKLTASRNSQVLVLHNQCRFAVAIQTVQ